MPIATPKFKVDMAAPNDARFQGVFDEIKAKLEITVPDGFLTGGIVNVLPGQNIGPVLFNNEWWVWDNDTEQYVIQDTTKLIGSIQFFAYSAVDSTKFLPCDGRVIPRAAPFDQLYAKIGTHFGDGDGSTTFQLPDLRGRAAIGVGTGLIPGGDTPDIPLSPRALGDRVGEEAHALAAAEVPALDATAVVKAVATGADKGYSATAGTAHNNMPPSIALIAVIRYA